MSIRIAGYTLFEKSTISARLSLQLILILLISSLAATGMVKSTPSQEPSGLAAKIPDLSYVATSSLAAKVNHMGYHGIQTADDHNDDNGDEGGGVPNAVNEQRVNKDYN